MKTIKPKRLFVENAQVVLRNTAGNIPAGYIAQNEQEAEAIKSLNVISELLFISIKTTDTAEQKDAKQ